MLDAILAYLPADFPWRETIRYYDTIESTNTAAKQMAAQGAPDGTVLIAGCQTGGRGRMGRSFHSPGSSGVYLSVILRPACPAAQLLHLTCAAGVAACDAVERACGLRPGLKWINDLVFGTRKLGGILAELVLDASGYASAAIIGIGINCSQSADDFPGELRSMATSVAMETGNAADISLITATLIAELERLSHRLLTDKAAIMDRYAKDCVTLGKEVILHRQESTFRATAVAVDADGGLIVLFPDGHWETVSSGEVSVRGMYGYI